MTELERTAKKIVAEFRLDGEKITMEEALEMAEYELKAKALPKEYQSDDEVKKKKKKGGCNYKASDAKTELFAELLELLTEKHGDSIKVLRDNKLIQLEYGGKIFKIDLIEQRAKK